MKQNLNEHSYIVYTVIAYRPDHTDSCCGCEMSRTESAQYIYTSDDIDHIAEKLARLRVFDDNSGREYGAYDYTVFINGHLAIGDIDLNEVYISYTDQGFIEQEYSNLEERVEHFRSIFQEDLNRQLQEKEKVAEDKRVRELELKELKELERLKAKYDKGNV
jgi:hypothetical protein